MTEPTWLTAGRAKLGVREAPGPANNPTIMGWAKTLGAKVLGIAFNGDATPWCGLFAAKCVNEVGLAPPPIAIRAKSWATWGKPVAASALAPGAVLVFERAGGGHVGFYVGEDATAYHVLGGNQRDAVTIVPIAKGRCIARRWPAGLPVIGKPVRLAAGPALSVNEA
ncbi:TIGR02594 family protein [Sphingomonas paucimobilis]|uniref:TIGR02594 family protein n=1 Tax=Sphingomonas paucimobilis TaxID=13689 RepID=UPI0013EED313|nr:TIGR02594 family protein [Sphingomonas paucimobilis]